MRNSNGSLHKALVEIDGRTLLAINVEQLLDQGFVQISIAVSVNESELKAHIRSQIAPLIAARSASLHIIEEAKPLGTIGAISKVAGKFSLVVVNVDNLSSIDLSSMLEHHEQHQANLTIASHLEEFRIPFGQLMINDDELVVEYREKPAFPVAISSGTYVVSVKAKSLIKNEQRTDITDLFFSLQNAAMKIVAYRHSENWIDINDRNALQMATENILKDRHFYSIENA